MHIDLGHCDVPRCTDCKQLRELADRVRQSNSAIVMPPDVEVDLASIMLDDPIERPSHYTVHTIQPIDVIEAWELPFHAACVVKYIGRYRYKGTPLEDLRKARWYLDRFIKAETKRREGR
jgi:hypothetical protein